jgi:hypothetical protein
MALINTQTKAQADTEFLTMNKRLRSFLTVSRSIAI